MDTIVLFETEIEPLNLFSRELGEGFKALGYSIYTYQIGNGVKSISELYEYMQSHRVKAMIGLNCSLFGLKTPGGANVWETLGIFCINILVDHPYWYHQILLSMPEYSAVLCVDKNHMKYVSRFYPHISVAGFLPHGGTVYPHENNERKIDILYAGSLWDGYGKNFRPDLSMFDFNANGIYDEVLSYLDVNTESTVEDAIVRILNTEPYTNISLSDDELRMFITTLRDIESIIGTKNRIKVLEAVADTGATVYIYGNGWEETDLIKLPNVHYCGFISPWQVLEKMSESKIVLNTMPWFKDGSHERIFNALLNGAIPVMEKNSYWDERLDDNWYIGYELNDESIHNMAGIVKSIVSDDEKFLSITSAISENYDRKDTWRLRAGEIHEALLGMIE